jgi:hypothetical protein
MLVEWVRPNQSLPADEIVEFFWQRDANPAWYLVYPDQWIKWRGTKAQIQQAKRNYLDHIGTDAGGYHESVSFHSATVDIDNDGQPDQLVQFKPGMLATLFLVLSPDGFGIDHKKSALLLRHSPWAEKSSRAFRKQQPVQPSNAGFRATGVEPIEDALHGARYGVFLYAGKVYFDLWWLQNPASAKAIAPTINDWRLYVFLAQGWKVGEACRFQFQYS